MSDVWPPSPNEPPDDLDTRALPIIDVAPLWFRCHRRVRGAVHFGRGTVGRFNHPGGRFGVLYVGLGPRAAFIEVFGDYTSLDPDDLNARVMSSLVPHRAVHLVDLSGGHLTRLGLDARISAGDHRLSQRWADALQRHPASPDGILYRCRHDPSQLAAAVFETAGLHVEASEMGASTLVALAAAYGIAVE